MRQWSVTILCRICNEILWSYHTIISQYFIKSCILCFKITSKEHVGDGKGCQNSIHECKIYYQIIACSKNFP